MKKFYTLFLGFILIGGVSFSANAMPVTPNFWITWQGTCLDCLAGPNGPAGSGNDNGNPSIATAIFGVQWLGNGIGGSTELDFGNLVEFSYKSAFLDLKSVHVNELLTYGTISNVPSSFAETQVSVRFRTGADPETTGYTFYSYPNGEWTVYQGPPIPNDFGTNG